MSAFDDAICVDGSAGSYAWDVPDGWQQGRGAWGGLVVGALVAAAEAEESDPSRVVRTITVQLVAPALVGRHQNTVETLRAGSSMTTRGLAMRAEDGGLIATAVVIAGAARAQAADDPGDWGVLSPPAVPAADDVPRVPGGPPFPVFTQHLDMRPISGLPFSGGPAETTGWVGYSDETASTAGSLLALVDAWWPAALPLLGRMPRVATVSFTANLLVDPATVSPGEPLLCHTFVSGARDGFASEQRRLWTADGRLVVENLQTIAIDV